MEKDTKRKIILGIAFIAVFTLFFLLQTLVGFFIQKNNWINTKAVIVAIERREIKRDALNRADIIPVVEYTYDGKQYKFDKLPPLERTADDVTEKYVGKVYSVMVNAKNPEEVVPVREKIEYITVGILALVCIVIIVACGSTFRSGYVLVKSIK